MAAQSDNKYDVYEWIKKVYDSCETLSQVMTANKLANNFRKVYNDSDLNWELSYYKQYPKIKIKNKNSND